VQFACHLPTLLTNTVARNLLPDRKLERLPSVRTGDDAMTVPAFSSRLESGRFAITAQTATWKASREIDQSGWRAVGPHSQMSPVVDKAAIFVSLKDTSRHFTGGGVIGVPGL
jgi:hypothetical protein